MKCEYYKTCPEFEYESFPCYLFKGFCGIRKERVEIDRRKLESVVIIAPKEK